METRHRLSFNSKASSDFRVNIKVDVEAERMKKERQPIAIFKVSS